MNLHIIHTPTRKRKRISLVVLIVAAEVTELGF